MFYLPCKYVHLVGAWCPWRSEESNIFPVTIVIDDCEPLCGFRELNSGTLQERGELNSKAISNHRDGSLAALLCLGCVM